MLPAQELLTAPGGVRGRALANTGAQKTIGAVKAAAAAKKSGPQGESDAVPREDRRGQAGEQLPLLVERRQGDRRKAPRTQHVLLDTRVAARRREDAADGESYPSINVEV